MEAFIYCIPKSMAPKLHQGLSNFFNIKMICYVFHGVFFGVLLFLTMVSPVHIHLTRAISKDGSYPCLRTHPARVPGAQLIPLWVWLITWWETAIYYCLLWLGKAQAPEQIVEPEDRSSVSPCWRVVGFLFMLPILCGDVQLMDLLFCEWCSSVVFICI